MAGEGGGGCFRAKGPHLPARRAPGPSPRLGEHLVAETAPPPPPKGGTQAALVLTILVCYAAGAAIGALSSRWDTALLILPAAMLAGAALLPERWTGLAAQRR
jgi:hypothetical protein